MRSVLFVSKPVTPPWNDSSKNLVRDVSTHLRGFEARVMTTRHHAAPPGTRAVPIYPQAGRFAPGLSANLRVLGRLLGAPLRRRDHLWHFFFAPNPRSSDAARWAARTRRMPTVQTVCSAPAREVDLRRVLFADVTIALSAHTEQRLASAANVVRIPPAIAPLPRPTPEQRTAWRRALQLPDAPIVVYPGDLEFGGGAERTIRAAADMDAYVVMACRLKTDAARTREVELRALADRLAPGRVQWVGETARIHDLLACADVVALPSETLYAKMDYPLVLLEAMLLERPVVVCAGTPAAELQSAGARAVDADVDALRAELRSLLDDADERARMGARSRAAVLERFSPSAVAAEYEAVYRSILG